MYCTKLFLAVRLENIGTLHRLAQAALGFLVLPVELA